MDLFNVRVCGDCKVSSECRSPKTCVQPLVDLQTGTMFGSFCG